MSISSASRTASPIHPYLVSLHPRLTVARLQATAAASPRRLKSRPKAEARHHCRRRSFLAPQIGSFRGCGWGGKTTSALVSMFGGDGIHQFTFTLHMLSKFSSCTPNRIHENICSNADPDVRTSRADQTAHLCCPDHSGAGGRSVWGLTRTRRT